jgi:hypothetical protein
MATNKKPECYNGQLNLKASGIQISFTSEQVDEWIKCSKDPIYFIKKYVKVIHVDRGTVPFELYDFQEDIIRTYHENRKAVVLTARQMGKCCQKDTLINIKNKETGQELTITMGEFHEMCKMQENI